MALKSFIEVHPDSHFSIQNLPYGVFKPQPCSAARPGVAIGDYVLDLSELASAGLFNGPILKNNSDIFLQVRLLYRLQTYSLCITLLLLIYARYSAIKRGSFCFFDCEFVRVKIDRAFGSVWLLRNRREMKMKQ